MKSDSHTPQQMHSPSSTKSKTNTVNVERSLFSFLIGVVIRGKQVCIRSVLYKGLIEVPSTIRSISSSLLFPLKTSVPLLFVPVGVVFSRGLLELDVGQHVPHGHHEAVHLWVQPPARLRHLLVLLRPLATLWTHTHTQTHLKLSEDTGIVVAASFYDCW